MKKSEIVLFETADNEVSLQVQMQDETVWLTRNQRGTCRSSGSRKICDYHSARRYSRKDTNPYDRLLQSGCNNLCWLSCEIETRY